MSTAQRIREWTMASTAVAFAACSFFRTGAAEQADWIVASVLVGALAICSAVREAAERR